MYELRKRFRFDAAHTLSRDIETQSSRRIHGHSYTAEVTLAGEPDPETGMLLDLGALELRLETVRAALDHHFLNDVKGLGPATIENLARWIWQALKPDCPALMRVCVQRESSGDSCSYEEPSRKG